MEIGQRLKFEKLGIKHAMPGSQGRWFIHCTTTASSILFVLIFIMEDNLTVYLKCHEKCRRKTSEKLRFIREISGNIIPSYSVGRCVIPWEFLGKSVKHIFSVEKCILFKKKDVSNFFLLF